MTQEKALEYLNLDLTQKIDKFMMKALLWFDVGLSLLAVVSNLVFETVAYSAFHWVSFGGLAVWCAALLIWCKLCHNPAHGLWFESVVSVVIALKMFFPSFLFIRMEKEFGLEHIAIAIVCAFLTVWMLRKKYKILKALHTETISQVRKKLQNEKANKIIVPISATAVIATCVVRFTRYSFDIDMGFCFWGLGCFFVYIATICLWNSVVASRYEIANLYKKKENS